MGTYLIALNEDSPDEWEKLKGLGPDVHILTNRLAFIRSSDTGTNIADLLGMTSNGGVNGFVSNLENGGLYGYNDSDFWKWIKQES